VPALKIKKIKLPKCPAGKKVDIAKKPFHNAMNINKLVKPQIGHIATSSDITAVTPVIAPIGINFGLYYSILSIL
jgi:hypothetical protein